MWWVHIVHTESGKIERKLGPIASERQAERVERGALINLNHDEYHTELVNDSETQEGQDHDDQ